MLKFIFVLVLLDAHNAFGSATGSDWRSQGLYRLRRDYPSQNHNQNALGSTTDPCSCSCYKAPEYLPPTTGEEPTTNDIKTTRPGFPLPFAPEIKTVRPELECDPLDPSTYPYPHPAIDLRANIPVPDKCSFIPITEKPFIAPPYLPPALNATGGKSSKTLRLDDVKGARPVWHVALYDKNFKPFMQICGGSVVRMDVVITAAHCVWGDARLRPAQEFAVGANKVHRPYGSPQDKKAQLSDVKEVIIPPRFRGSQTTVQDDIAVLKLATPFTYARGLRPVCVNFEDDFDTEQLSEGNYGTVAGWGYTSEKATPAQYLLWLELPYVPIERCIASVDESFVKYLTSDKICAGKKNADTAICRGDSGGGLVFWHSEAGSTAPFLRGIASTAEKDGEKACNGNTIATFSQIAAHRRFLLKHVPGIDQECRYLYSTGY